MSPVFELGKRPGTNKEERERETRGGWGENKYIVVKT